MASPICYASLAIYSKRDISDELGEVLHVAPVRTGDRRGTFSWIYSTQEFPSCHTVEQQLELLKSKFEEQTHELRRLSSEGHEIRAWIYFGMSDVNQSFVVSPEFTFWLSQFGADIYVDIWTDRNEAR